MPPIKWDVGVPADQPLCKPFGRDSVIAAIECMKQGRLIVVTDDESRENEGDLIMAGEFASPETIGFMIRYTSGVICCSVRPCLPRAPCGASGLERPPAAPRPASVVKRIPVAAAVRCRCREKGWIC
jgi:hypothetical protein